MKFAVVVFPGSNCDHDSQHAAVHVLGQQAECIWHKDTSLTGAVAHGEGNYYADPPVIRDLEASRRVVFRYCDERGEVTDGANPNGATNGIAGICNEARNVVGLMPHPERACEAALGSADGLVLFESVIGALTQEGAIRTA